ncbi:hypothetical protein CEXT_163671 [Caerostris extrusa]|uniref:Uncharacterized protein n=1 Tax=Caerostris extrusa TaxID=172846 RepID=A0AAV4M6T0_CAEEX|nr:hypothetical protein CEXT_163671 [Caerostris extrusa]
MFYPKQYGVQVDSSRMYPLLIFCRIYFLEDLRNFRIQSESPFPASNENSKKKIYFSEDLRNFPIQSATTQPLTQTRRRSKCEDILNVFKIHKMPSPNYFERKYSPFDVLKNADEIQSAKTWKCNAGKPQMNKKF